MPQIQHKIIIEAGRNESQYWRDLWNYRELLFFLVWRDILVRYRQTTIGVLWAVFRPVTTMIVLTVIFGQFAKLPSGNVPYSLFVLSGLLPWQFFAGSLIGASESLHANTGMITKVYFPRMLIPMSILLVNLVDLLISALVFVGLMAWYEVPPHLNMMTLPCLLFLMITTSYGIGLWAAALTVRYRDLRVIVPFLIQIGIFISPVGFSSDLVPDAWHTIYFLNPMAGIIDAFRWAVLGTQDSLHLHGLGISISVAMLLIYTGICYFRRTEKLLADII